MPDMSVGFNNKCSVMHAGCGLHGPRSADLNSMTRYCCHCHCACWLLLLDTDHAAWLNAPA